MPQGGPAVGRTAIWTKTPAQTLVTTSVELSAPESRMLMTIARFALVVCHELRNPLSSALASLGMLQELSALPEKSVDKRLLDNALTSIAVLKARTDDMLDIVNFTAGSASLQVEEVDVGAVMLNTARILRGKARRAGVRITVSVEDGIPKIEADPARLGRVVEHLVQNALNYAAEGRRVDARACLRDKNVVIEIQDYGPGINPEKRMRLLQPEYQGAQPLEEVGGLGIGLTLCKILVEQHGGQISVVAEPGKGSHFFVTLPLERGAGPGERIVPPENPLRTALSLPSAENPGAVFAPHFYKGDTVALKDGGPPMVVVGTLKDGDPDSERWLKKGIRAGCVLCRWLDESSRREMVYPFPPELLELAPG